jgi:hypothetical protein
VVRVRHRSVIVSIGQCNQAKLVCNNKIRNLTTIVVFKIVVEVQMQGSKVGFCQFHK